MAQMLLLNPRKRRASGKKRRKNPSAKQRAARARFARMARSRSFGRASNPAPRRRRRSAARRRNPAPLMAYRRRRSARRRNPISGGLLNFRSYLAPLKDAAVMGAGAIAVDAVFNYINRMLPANMRAVQGQLGVGTIVKLLGTIAIGKLLAGPTRSLSTKAAMGSLVVQARDIAMSVLPDTMKPNLGFVTAGRVVPGNGRVNSNMVGMNGSPLLSRIDPGNNTMLQRVYPTGATIAPSRAPLRRV